MIDRWTHLFQQIEGEHGPYDVEHYLMTVLPENAPLWLRKALSARLHEVDLQAESWACGSGA